MHVTHCALPTFVLYFPALHTVHAVAAALRDSVPAPQFAHDAFEATLLNFPAMQDIQTVAPVLRDSAPAGQTVHSVFACEFLYVPAEQLVHALAVAPSKPPLHVQLLNVELPDGEFEFAGHEEPHAVAPALTPYLPCVQSVQIVLPCVS